MAPSDAELATDTLTEEGKYHFSTFTASDALTLVSSFQLRAINRAVCKQTCSRGFLCANVSARLRDIPKAKVL